MDFLCRRYSCVPSALLAEDVGLLRMLAIVTHGAPDAPQDNWDLP